MEVVKSLLFAMPVFGVVWLVLEKKRGIWSKVTGFIESRREGTIYAALFLGVLLLLGWTPLLRHLPISSDETYTMAGAAYFAGYDWSAYMHMKKFYNFGYTIWLSPVYRIFSNPVTIYRVMLFANIIVHAVIVVLAYRILRKNLKCSKCFSIAVSFVCTCNALILFFRGYLYNEIPLMLIMWLTALLLLELSEAAGKQRIALSAVLGLVAAYAYLVHSRCLIIYAAMLLLLLLYLLVYRKWLIQPASFAVVFAVGLYCGSRLVEFVQVHLYQKGAGVVMKNSVEHVATGTWRYRALLSLDGIKDLLCRFLNQAGAMAVETGGILILATAAVIYFMIKNFKKLRKGEADRKIFILLFYSAFALWGMAAATALTGASNGKVRFLAYTRYCAPFIGVFLLIGMVLLKGYRKTDFSKLALWTIVLTVVAGGILFLYMYPQVADKSIKEGVTSFFFFIPFARNPLNPRFSKWALGIAVSLMAAFVAGFLFLYRRRQMVAICTAAIIFSMCLLWQVEQQKCSPASERRLKLANAGKELVQDKELERLYGADIYCIGSDTYKKTLLFQCYDEEDIIYDEEGIAPGTGDIVLSNSEEKLVLYAPDYVCQLDDNEWAGMWDEDLYHLVRERYHSLQ